MSTILNEANWMDGIPDTTPVQNMSIPGTHESGALLGGGPTQCQWLEIGDQLRRGIRFIDLRCAHAYGSLGSKEFPVYHGGVYQNSNFEDVQDACIKFLQAHPSEFILMNVQQNMVPNLRNRTADEFFDTFVTLYDPSSWLFPSAIQTAKDWRGKIVLVRPYDPESGKGWPSTQSKVSSLPGPGLVWNGFVIDGTSYNALFETQNGWEKWSNDDDKEAAVKQYLNLAYDGQISPERFFLNFFSRAGTAYVGTAAENINNYFQAYLRNNLRDPGRRLGILPIDFTGNTGWTGSLEELIILRNTFKPGYSVQFQVSPFKLLLSQTGQPWQGQFMAPGEHDWSVIGYPSSPGRPNADNPIIFERYTYEGKDYFKRKGHDQYLSCSSGGQVGLYNWNGARTFTADGPHLLSDYYNNKPMRAKNNGELWCGDDGDLMDVIFAPA